MIQSDLEKKALTTIKTILVALDESLIHGKIDEPVEKAAETFRYQQKSSLDYQLIHRILSDFVNHIYTTGLQSDWIISDSLAETLLILDRFYQGTSFNGYAGAMIDAANNKSGGIDGVLLRLKEIIKTTERQKFIKAVFTSAIDHGDWPLKCQIVQSLLEKYQPILPPELLGCSPEQIVDEIPSFLSLTQNSFTTLQQISDFHKKTQDK